MTGYFGECAARPLIAAHRGYKARYPENTMLAYRKAQEAGADMLEIDLSLTKDHQIALVHDRTVDRTTNGSGQVDKFTLTELQKLDAGQGERVPSFEEFLDWASRTSLYLNVEIKTKTNRHVDQAVALLERYKMLERCVIACFDANITEYACRQYAVRTQGFIGHAMKHFGKNSYDFLYSVGLEMCDLTPALAEEFNGRGIQPWCWCPDTHAEIRHMLACGATLCTCNDLAPAMEIINNKQLIIDN